jgi:hypothetical protein
MNGSRAGNNSMSLLRVKVRRVRKDGEKFVSDYVEILVEGAGSQSMDSIAEEAERHAETTADFGAAWVEFKWLEISPVRLPLTLHDRGTVP